MICMIYLKARLRYQITIDADLQDDIEAFDEMIDNTKEYQKINLISWSMGVMIATYFATSAAYSYKTNYLH